MYNSDLIIGIGSGLLLSYAWKYSENLSIQIIPYMNHNIHEYTK